MRNCVCTVVTTKLGIIGWSDVANAEKFGRGDVSHDITNNILEFIYGWYLEGQTFTGREEAEIGNVAASMAITYELPGSVQTSPAERALITEEACTQFKQHDSVYNNLKAQGNHGVALRRYLNFRQKAYNHQMYPHATQGLVQEQAAAQACLELPGDDELIGTEAMLEMNLLSRMPRSQATTTPQTAAGKWQSLQRKDCLSEQESHNLSDRETEYRIAAEAEEQSKQFEATRLRSERDH